MQAGALVVMNMAAADEDVGATLETDGVAVVVFDLDVLDHDAMGAEQVDAAAAAPIDSVCLLGIAIQRDLTDRGVGKVAAADERERAAHPGAGGLGEIYRARHLRMNRAFAVKLLQQTMVGRPDFVGRFEREARALSRLTHPCCVAVTDFGISEEHGPFIVMELVEGVPLSTFTRGQGLPLGEAVELIMGVLSGLDHAHRQGIGTRLLAELAWASIQHGATALTLEVRVSNLVARIQKCF